MSITATLEQRDAVVDKRSLAKVVGGGREPPFTHDQSAQIVWSSTGPRVSRRSAGA